MEIILPKWLRTVTPAVVSVATTDSCQSEKDIKCPIRPSVAYDIAASAASYVQSRAKELSPVGSEAQEEENDMNPIGHREGTQEEADNSPRFYKSEVAAYMAASAMTSVVAAGETEKQEAAMDLQSLHSSPCEWFICDDLSKYTRCFVIQVIFFFPVDPVLCYLQRKPSSVSTVNWASNDL